MSEIIDVMWFTPWTGNLEYVGIVKIKTEEGYEYRIGTGLYANKEDAENIKEKGDILDPKIFKEELCKQHYTS